MRGFGLFSGIGGFELAFTRAGGELLGTCEIDERCGSHLKEKWPHVYHHDDIKTLSDTRGADILFGGFPCQPWSVAGKRRGTGDDRDLWPEFARLIELNRPKFVLGENVPGLDDKKYMGLDRVLSDLECLDYEALTFEIPACAKDAPHGRSRLWIVAHASRRGRHQRTKIITRMSRRDQTQEKVRRSAIVCSNNHEWLECHDEKVRRVVGDAYNARLQRYGRYDECPSERSAWASSERFLCHDEKVRRVKPGLRLLAHGIPGRVAKLSGYGNAIVPQIAEEIFRAMIEASR